MYDIVIIGGGPAGLSAAITARARNKKVLVISNRLQDNLLAASKLVDNYPGMPEATGLDILETIHNQAKKLGVEFLEARVISIVPMENNFFVNTSKDVFEGQSIIIASGTASSGRPIKGEEEFLGRGVSYCATCDGMLYRNATVLVVGMSPEAAEEANFLAELGATVHHVASDVPPNLDTRVQHHQGKVVSIEGDVMGVTHVVVSERPQPGEGTARKKKSVEVQGVFVFRPGLAPATMLSSLEMQDGYIKVDAGMRTNVAGIFAAGDCTGEPRQIATAVGQGQIAAFSAVEFLA